MHLNLLFFFNWNCHVVCPPFHILVRNRIDHNPLNRAGYVSLNSSTAGQNDRHFADVSFNWIFCEWKICILLRILLKFIPKDSFDVKSVLIQIMTWRQTGDGHYLKQCWPSSMTNIHAAQGEMSWFQWLMRSINLCVPVLVADIAQWNIGHVLSVTMVCFPTNKDPFHYYEGKVSFVWITFKKKNLCRIQNLSVQPWCHCVCKTKQSYNYQKMNNSGILYVWDISNIDSPVTRTPCN